MLHEDWESELNLVVMRDEVYERLHREEYRCPVCFSPLHEEKGIEVLQMRLYLRPGERLREGHGRVLGGGVCVLRSLIKSQIGKRVK